MAHSFRVSCSRNYCLYVGYHIDDFGRKEYDMKRLGVEGSGVFFFGPIAGVILYVMIFGFLWLVGVI